MVVFNGKTISDLLILALASDAWMKPYRYKDAEDFFNDFCYDEDGNVLEEDADSVREFIDRLKEWDYDEYKIFEENFDTSEL